MIARLLARAKALWRARRRSDVEGEVDEEFRVHIEMRAEDLVRSGLSRAEAQRRALIEFGSVERYKEEALEAFGDRRLPFLETFVYDARFVVRSIRREAGTSMVAVIVLALGIGLPTVMYSWVDPALHPTARLRDGDRLVGPVRNTRIGFDPLQMSARQYLDWAARQRSFEGLAAHMTGSVNLRLGDHPVRYQGRYVTANAFALVSARPLLGRGFVEDDGLPGAPLAVVIGFRAWQDQFDGDRSVIGARVLMNGEPAQVVGVMDARFGFPLGAEVWVPLRLDPANPTGPGGPLWVFGKLAEGVSVHAASAEAVIVAAEASAGAPGTTPSALAEVRRLGQLPRWAMMMMYSMLATSVLVLLIASANVASLLLTRTVARSRDVAVRTALGQTRARTIAQLMTEAGALATVGASLGIGVAWIGTGMLTRLFRLSGAPAALIEVDRRAFLFIVLLTAVATLASGVLPALRASSAKVNDAIKDGAGGSVSLRMGRLTRGMVIAEVAMSVALLVASGLMLKGVLKTLQVELPFDARTIFTAEIGAFDGRPADAATRRLFWDEVERQLSGIQGVTALGLANRLPGVGTGPTLFTIEGAIYPTDGDVPVARSAVVSPGFFATFAAEPIEGRIFDRLDNADALPVVVVNQSFARLHFRGNDVLGRRIRIGGSDSEKPWRTIVGVVPDLYMAGLRNPGSDDQPAVYVPLAQEDAVVLMVVATAGSSPLRIRGPVRNAVATADAETAVNGVMTLDDRIRRASSPGPFGGLFLAYGVAALFMSSVGLYGVMAFGVSRRGTEMGIRMALGSSPAQVRTLVLGEGIKQLAIGLGVGCALALGMVRLPEFDQLINDVFFDLPTYGIVLGVLAGAGLLACALPALRATRVDPAVALRAG